MKVAFPLIEQRRERLAEMLRKHSYLPVQELCKRLQISEATARRDLSVLARDGRIIRTFGGALSEFNEKFASFRERQEVAAPGKYAIAEKAASLIVPGSACFLDTGTTTFALAERLQVTPVHPLSIITNSLPVAERLADIPEVDVFLLGGQVLTRQSALLGTKACRALSLYMIDIAFVSVEGMDAQGLWNSQEDIVAFQRALLKRSRRVVFCVDKSKLGHRASTFLIPWAEVDSLVSDVSLEELRNAGVSLRKNQFLPT